MKPLELGATLHIAADPRTAFSSLAALGLTTAQIFPPHSLDAEATSAAAREAGIEITAVIAHFDGENYADIPTVSRTVGLVPLDTREARTAHFLRLAEFAAQLGVQQVQTHIGFVPEDPADPNYAPLVAHTQSICDKLATSDQIFALETGQETAKTLARFLSDVNRPNLRLNFDPANMIMYGNDTPLAALELLYPFIRSVHVKDGVWPTQSGQLGAETPFGEGQVNFATFLPRLLELGFRGSLTIEREIEGEEQKRDILSAKSGVEAILADFNAQQ